MMFNVADRAGRWAVAAVVTRSLPYYALGVAMGIAIGGALSPRGRVVFLLIFAVAGVLLFVAAQVVARRAARSLWEAVTFDVRPPGLMLSAWDVDGDLRVEIMCDEDRMPRERAVAALHVAAERAAAAS